MSPTLKREIKGIALLLFGVFLAGALAWQGVADFRGVEDSGGAFGIIGRFAARPLATFFGWPSVWLIPMAVGAYALHFFGRFNDSRERAWLVLFAGLSLILPIVIGVILGGERETVVWQGIWGGFLSYVVIKAVGTGGAWILLLLLVSVLTAATLAWNPIRMIVGGGAAARAKESAPQSDTSHLDEYADNETEFNAKLVRRPSIAEALAPDPNDLPSIDPSEDFSELKRVTSKPYGIVDLSADKNPVVSHEGVNNNVGADDDLDDTDEYGDEGGYSEDTDMAPAGAQTSAEASAAVAKPTSPSLSQSPSSSGSIEKSGDTEAYADEEVPPTTLLSQIQGRNPDVGKRELDLAGERLIATLKTFKVEGTLVGRTTGPAVTQFEVAPAPGVKVRQIANLSNDLALAMRAPSIRVVAPIPGKGAVGIEVPNPVPEVVGFRELIESQEFQTARAALPIALGKDLEGRPVIADLAKMPHLLIAGATGAGKSVCINTIISSLLFRHTRERLRFLMVDPKMVELSVYNKIPHLRHKVVTDNRDAASVLKWAVIIMQERYALLAENGARNLEDFNRKVRAGTTLRKPKSPDVAFEQRTYTEGELPYIVLIIDELADLMMTVQGEVETPLAMLAQKARAIGIHLILATQRPSVNVITGLIKANFPSRIAFRVASQVDSRTILDSMGAESLLGNGDMLFIPPGRSEPSRLQGAYISSEDTERLMDWYEAQKEAKMAALHQQFGDTIPPEESQESEEDDILETVRALEADASGDGGRDGDDEEDRDKLFRSAAEIVIHHQHGSTSLLQRRLKIGYGRAARIIDQLNSAGVLGPPDGPRPREVLMGLEDLDRIAPK